MYDEKGEAISREGYRDHEIFHGEVSELNKNDTGEWVDKEGK